MRAWAQDKYTIQTELAVEVVEIKGIREERERERERQRKRETGVGGRRRERQTKSYLLKENGRKEERGSRQDLSLKGIFCRWVLGPWTGQGPAWVHPAI